MSKIDAIEFPEFTVKKTGEKKSYYKIKSDGKTYSAFPGTAAFNQLKDGVFSLGDTVKLNYESSQVGEITYKNLTKLEASDEKPAVTRTMPSNPVKSFDDVRQTMIIRQNALRHADELAKIDSSISGEPADLNLYFGRAEQIEKWIRRT